jgi:ribosome-associated heat shock protein Hsp15
VTRERDSAAESPLTEVRLDVFLDVACLFPTRSQAAAACRGGKVDVNGRAAAPHKVVRVGDALGVTFPSRKRTFRVVELREHHVKKAEARTLVEETTPPERPEVLEARRLERLLAPKGEPAGKPSKKERRDRARLRGY